MNPTLDIYQALETAYKFFNSELFDGKLPPVLFTGQRQKNTMGYFSPNRWSSQDGTKCHEIAINPMYVGRTSIIEMLQTLVHEMCHCWQHSYGTPSKAYHNKEWADYMINIGLMPSTTGQPGGKTTGQSMSDYPAPDGRFIKACVKLIESGFKWLWIDTCAYVRREVDVSASMDMAVHALENLDTEIIEQLTTPLSSLFDADSFVIEDPDAEKKMKSKYTCPGCSINFWGKRGIRAKCIDCEQIFEEQLNTLP